MVDLEAWERSKPHLQSALDAAGNTHDLDDVFSGIIAGDYQFWHTPDSYCVTEIINYPKKTVLNFWLAGGKMKSLRNVIDPIVCRWAVEEHGCVEARSGLKFRKGWDRIIPEGYTEYARDFRKVLE